MIQKMARQFAEAELFPIAGDMDAHHHFPRKQISSLGELGLMGVAVSDNFGGAGMDYVAYAVALEEISRGCASTGVIMSVNNSLYCGPVERFGTDEQKAEFLEPCDMYQSSDNRQLFTSLRLRCTLAPSLEIS